MNTSEHGWNPKVEVRSGRGTVYGPAGMSSGPSSQRSRALCLTLGAAVLAGATLFAAEGQPIRPRISRKKLFQTRGGVQYAISTSPTGCVDRSVFLEAGLARRIGDVEHERE